MGFKEDEQFLRYLTMGAAGSAAVGHYLTDRHGHRVVELERYTMANKLWATKVKRLRLPDLMCIDCGLRVEARAKSKLEIKVSDSDTPGREWDAGLREDDVIAFVHWEAEHGRASERPECFTVGALRESLSYSRVGGRKASSEGSEVDRSWTARSPTTSGRVLEVEGRKVRTELATGRRQTYQLPEGCPAYVYVAPADAFGAGDRFLLGVVQPPPTLDCPGPTWDHRSDLESSDPVSRYAAVKAAGIRRDASSIDFLAKIAADASDWRMQLEALASLARIDPATYTSEVAQLAASEEEERAMAMEATFVLSELGSDEAAESLLDLGRDTNRDPELRSAAVWGLGVAGLGRPDLVLGFVADDDDDVALHALAGIGELPDALIDDVRGRLDERGREGAAAAALLARQGVRGARALLTASREVRTLVWALAGLEQMPEFLVKEAGELLPDVEEALRPTWASREQAWLGLAEGSQELLFLERQTIRHKPPEIGEAPHA